MKWRAILALLMAVAMLLVLPTVILADGVCPCPEDTILVAKFEYNESTGTYVQTEGQEGIITIGEGANASGGSWTSTVEIKAVVVKGSTDCSTDWRSPTATSGTFSNEDLQPTSGGEQPDISSVTFCKPKPTAVQLVNFSARSLKIPWFVNLLRRLWPW